MVKIFLQYKRNFQSDKKVLYGLIGRTLLPLKLVKYVAYDNVVDSMILV